jgi:replication-associated recombination protein RarA
MPRETRQGFRRATQSELTCSLAERSRPSTLDGYIGQADIVGPGSLLRARIEAGEGVGSCILWGPPGCGKTYVQLCRVA